MEAILGGFYPVTALRKSGSKVAACWRHPTGYVRASLGRSPPPPTLGPGRFAVLLRWRSLLGLLCTVGVQWSTVARLYRF